MVYRLLVVAGESELLRALPGQLGDDVEVTLLATVNDALWEVRSAPPEAIIADIDLPEMSGLEMAEILPSFDVPTRVLLYSSEQNPAAQKQAQDYGVHRFLYGPLSTEDLHTALREAISHAEETRSAAVVTESAETPVSEAKSVPPTAVDDEPPAPAKTERFTPARVRLSPISARSGRMASRSRPDSDTPPNQQPTPAPSHSSHPQRRRDGTLVLTADNLTPIRSIMSRLAQDLGTQCIMLTDRAGMVLVEVGTTDGLPTMILLPLLSTSFSTAGEVARQLHEEDATTLYIHEGVHYDLYCFDIVQRFLLVLVFNKKVASSKIGTVWISTKRAIRELHDALS